MTIVAPAYLSQFGSTTIPGARGRFQWPGAARPSTVPTINGTFDASGTGTAGILLPYQLTYTGAVFDATDSSAVQADLDTLRALTGTWDKLTMAMADGTTRWAYARLVNVSPEMTATARTVITFAALWQVSTIWYGDAMGATATPNTLLFRNGLYGDLAQATTISALPIELYNAGNAPVHDAGIVVQAGSADITAFTLTMTGSVVPTGISEMEFSGTILAGANLVIDCGARTIRNNGTDAFAYWRRTANHTTDKWATIPVGASSWTMAATGGAGDSLILFTYADGFA